MSLKNNLEHYLKKNGYMSLQDLDNFCKSEHKKLSNGERRLRELMAVNPYIKPVTNSRHAIIGYKWINTNEPTEFYKDYINQFPAKIINKEKTLF